MASLQLALFGGFQATFDNRPVTDFSTNKVRALLAYLAVNAQTNHQRTHLATLFWGDWSDREALANLRKALFRLRRTLNQLAPEYGDTLLAISRTTVQWQEAAATVDVLVFRTLLAQVKAHNHHTLSTCLLCVERLAHAAALYDGDFLAGFPDSEAPEFEEWMTIQREVLHGQALETLSVLCRAYWQQQAWEPLQNAAQQQLELEPWHEEAHRFLMRVFAAQGRRDEALAQYERCRRLLDAELGVEPDAETQQLLADIRNQAGTTLVGDEDKKRPKQALLLHNFPAQSTPFIGREKIIGTLQARLRDPDCRLLTLVGAGGVGKTRLAIETVARLKARADLFPDGCTFIPLASVTTSDRLVSSIGERLALTFREGTALEQQVLDAMRERAMLLVMDNYEQLVPDTTFLEEILSAAPAVKVLVTSRIPLNLRAEWRWPLAGLDVPAPAIPLEQVASCTAVQLFQSAAGRIIPDFRINEENMAAVSDICRHLAGMPLAIEIAAGWLRLHSLPELANKIETGVEFLASHARDMPERHRNLRLVFDHSWQLLSAEERHTFARLTCFQGSFSLEAAQQITDASLLALMNLLDHTLLQRLQNGRYGLHPVLHHFAHAYLENAQPLYDRHALFYLDLVAAETPKFATRAAPDAVSVISNDLDNVRHAWHWAVKREKPEWLATGLDGLLSFYQFRGFFSEGQELFAQAAGALAGRPEAKTLVNRLRLAQAACFRKLGDLETAIQLAEQVAAENDAATNTAAIIALGQLYELRGDNFEALKYLEQARLLLAEQENPTDLAEVFNRMGKVYRYLNQIEESINALSAALALNQEAGNETGAAENHANLGLIYKDLGQFTEAIFHVQQAISLARKLNHRENIARFTQNLGLIYWQMDELDKALSCYRQALEMAEILKSKRGIAMCLGGIGVIMRRKNQFQESLGYYQRALQLAESIPDKNMQSTLLGNTGNVFKEIGEYDQAISYQQRALAIDRALGSSGGVCRHLGNIGDILKEQGFYEKALPYFEEAIPLFRDIDARYYLCWVLVAYGEALFALGRYDEAEEANAEGGRIARELDRRPYIFYSRILDTRLIGYWGNEKAALQQLDSLEATFDDLEYRAEIAFVRWEIQDDAATHQEAVRLYTELAGKTGIYRHRQRLASLQAAVKESAPVNGNNRRNISLREY